MQMLVKRLTSSSEKITRAAHPQGGRVVKQVNTWLTHCGPEWTVDRLKAIQIAAIQLRAGNVSVVKTIYQQNSISYRKSDLIVKGPFGPVMRDFVRGRRPIVLRRCMAVFRVYTAIRLDKITMRQQDKLVKSITAPYSGEQPMNLLAGIEVRAAKHRKNLRLVETRDVRRLKPWTSVYIPKEYAGHFSDLSKKPFGKLAISMITAPPYPEGYFSELFPLSNPLHFLCTECVGETTFNGKLAFIQEKGCKLRTVAVPSGWNQLAFEPLASMLDSLAKEIPESCVHDQDKGVYFVEQAMLAGKEIFCFDLSAATDRFPRFVQFAALRGLGLDSYVEMLEDTCHSWETSLEGHQVVHYEVGQPMGLYGSFSLFHTTHIFMLEYICDSLEVYDSPYRVLGDDVVITNHKVAEAYRSIMERLGVELSPTKTIQSTLVAEFAGFLTVQTSRGVHSFRPYKHPDRYLTNHISLMYNLGHVVPFRYHNKNVKLFFSTLRDRSPSLSPLIARDKYEPKSDSAISRERFFNFLSQVYLRSYSPTSEEYNTCSDAEEYLHEVLEGCCEEVLPSSDVIKISQFLDSCEQHLDSKPDALETTVYTSISSDPLIAQKKRQLEETVSKNEDEEVSNSQAILDAIKNGTSL